MSIVNCIHPIELAALYLNSGGFIQACAPLLSHLDVSMSLVSVPVSAVGG